MRNLLLLTMLFAISTILISSCKKEEVKPNYQVVSCGPDSMGGYNFGNTVYENGILLSTKYQYMSTTYDPSNCVKYGHTTADDSAGNRLVWYSLTSTMDYINKFNPGKVHELTWGYQEWFKTDDFYSNFYFTNYSEITNASFQVHCIHLTDITYCPYKRYYYATVTVKWEAKGKKYKVDINTLISVDTDFK